MPILFPRNAEEIITFGLYGIALSRASGCLVALKIVADVADGLWTVDRDFADVSITVPQVQWEGRPWSYRQRVLAAPPDSLLAEADLFGPRWSLVDEFIDANPLDTIDVDPAEASLAIVAVGSAYNAAREALGDLGLADDDLVRAGIRVMRVGAPFPLGKGKIGHVVRGVSRVLVVEDKTAFVESQLKELLYGTAEQPEVLGKASPDGSPLIPADGELTAARLLGPLRRVLKGQVVLLQPATPPPPLQLQVLPIRRTPYFCSGCPHNRSTVIPEGSLAGGGIGCHTLVTMSSRTDSQVTGLTQMGGEGAQWIGQAPFTDVPHIFQNVGDGTYFHSGQLAVQACVAAGVNITYKVLFNSAVAMTGAQDAEAGLTVPALTHKLDAEGVQRIIVCVDEPARHRNAHFAANTTLWDRDRLDEAQRILRDTPGVTVLIYDQQCAADARRKRKRGAVPARRTRVIINEAVCEGCGDCGVKSNCLSVQPVDTEFGRKTRIDQTGCNTDYSCLEGNCPSFVTVELPEARRAPKKQAPTPPATPDPTLPQITGSYGLFLAGIGGTGIVTVNQLLGMAALRSGLQVEGLDQTGLSQKAGPVTSHLRLSRKPTSSSNRIMPGRLTACSHSICSPLSNRRTLLAPHPSAPSWWPRPASPPPGTWCTRPPSKRPIRQPFWPVHGSPPASWSIWTHSAPQKHCSATPLRRTYCWWGRPISSVHYPSRPPRSKKRSPSTVSRWMSTRRRSDGAESSSPIPLHSMRPPEPPWRPLIAATTSSPYTFSPRSMSCRPSCGKLWHAEPPSSSPTKQRSCRRLHLADPAGSSCGG